ncbi:MAG: porin [Beijerinckiaceae bacterium]
MKVVKSLLLGSAAGLVAVAGAQAADLPTRKAAPVEYVRICDAYGAGFFYIPGTDTCLKVGGLALFETRIFNTPYSIGSGFFSGQTAVPVIPGLGFALPLPGVPGAFPATTAYRNPRARDNYGMTALGRLELDARTQTGYGTLRAFIRIDSSFGGSSTTQTGALNQLYNTTAGPFPAKEQTILNKAFIQFAGLTAGRAQSMFDFYADAYNYESLRGSNATEALLAYTATFGGGFSATLSVEDGVERRNAIASTISLAPVAGAAFGAVAGNPFGIGAGGVPYAAFQAGQQIPDIVGNLRVDQEWGSVQLSGAAHQLRTTLYPTAAPVGLGAFGTPLAFGNPAGGVFVGGAGFATNPAQTSNDFGFAVQAGIKLNVPQIAPGDTFYLQGTYERGATGYILGNNLAYTGGFWASSLNYGNGVAATPSSNGWVKSAFDDCAYTVFGRCEQQQGFAVISAFKHFWAPTWSSAIFGSYMQVREAAAAQVPVLGNVLGIPNFKEYRIGTNLVWTPVKGFDIGAEFMYIRGITDKPVGLANDLALAVVGLPRFQSTSNVYEGRIRVQRAF